MEWPELHTTPWPEIHDSSPATREPKGQQQLELLANFSATNPPPVLNYSLRGRHRRRRKRCHAWRCPTVTIVAAVFIFAAAALLFSMVYTSIALHPPLPLRIHSLAWCQAWLFNSCVNYYATIFSLCVSSNTLGYFRVFSGFFGFTPSVQTLSSGAHHTTPLFTPQKSKCGPPVRFLAGRR